ncbi:MAG: ABC transporter permease, partial [Rhodoluna sp.]
GGRGNVRGTILGAFVIGFLADGLVIVGVSEFWKMVIKGAVIILAVAIDQAQQKTTVSKKKESSSATKNNSVGASKTKRTTKNS